MREEVRILLVGDEGVGKSTLITSLIKEAFVEGIQHVIPEVTIPPEWTREKVTTRIVDSSDRPENRHVLDEEIKKADVICIVYSITQPTSFTNISAFWLPYIRGLGRNVPVVLVGNKIDTRGPDITNPHLQESILPIMADFKEVETCVECSAKGPLNVSEVFYFAQKAILHPTAPLYDSREHCLKLACVEALRRIFRLCDADKDGVLNDEEINAFQDKCFGAPLQRSELESVKAVVAENEPQGITGAGLTEIGFLYLHTLFIQRGRLETTWTVLRRFGYGDDVQLREDFLRPNIDVPEGCSVELSSEGYRFLSELFQTFDKDTDGALRGEELDNLFSTTPGIPWTGFPDSTITNDEGAITLQGFLAQWSMTTLLDYKLTLAYLAYLGYEKDSRAAVVVTKPKKFGRRRAGASKLPYGRSCFLGYVFGATGSGKTTLLRAHVKKAFNPVYVPTDSARSPVAVNSTEIGGAEKHLVLQEVGPAMEHAILTTKKRMDMCDVACMVYDSSDVNSFAYVAALCTNYAKELESVPVVFVATKSDCDLVPQRYEVQPDVFCRNLGLGVPLSVSIKESVTANLFALLTGVCMDPEPPLLGGGARRRAATSTALLARNSLIGTATALTLMGAVWIGYRYMKHHG